MTAKNASYSVLTGQGVYGGQAKALPPVGAFESFTLANVSDGLPGSAELGKPLIVDLHGSGGQGQPQGRHYTATVGGRMAFDTHNQFTFYLVAAYHTIGGAIKRFVKLRPIDSWMNGSTKREAMHVGFREADGVHLYCEARYDAVMAFALANFTEYDLNTRCLVGGSMGGWGTISYGVRRHGMFAALYPDRPRWRYAFQNGEVATSSFASGWATVPTNSGLRLSAADGGGDYAKHLDMIAYISNPKNKVRPILWCCGKADGYMQWSEQCDAVDALRATNRAFAFAWNTGNHSGGSIMQQLRESYPYGTYSLDKGYPIFTEHSLDKDPRVDDEGGINIGLSFKNVTENGIRWSCEVTNISSACTVKVKPWSEKFTADVAPKLVTIPAAGTYVAVEFNA